MPNGTGAEGFHMLFAICQAITMEEHEAYCCCIDNYNVNDRWSYCGMQKANLLIGLRDWISRKYAYCNHAKLSHCFQ